MADPCRDDRHPLRSPDLLALVEQEISRHLGRPWVCGRLTDLADRSSHPAALLHGDALSAFAKVLDAPDAREQALAELAGLSSLKRLAGAATPRPIGSGQVEGSGVIVLLTEALVERPPDERTEEDWLSIGRALAGLHAVTGPEHGWVADGYFGPLPQDNRPVPSGRWAEFYAERRLRPRLRSAVERGQLPAALARQVEKVVDRLPVLVGEEPSPTLLHGDAQHHNFISTRDGAVVIDATPYYGHPEVDLALVDYFTPVPAELFTAYRDLRPIDDGFAERRELWRLFAYLGVLTVDGSSAWAKSFLPRLAAAAARYA